MTARYITLFHHRISLLKKVTKAGNAAQTTPHLKKGYVDVKIPAEGLLCGLIGSTGNTSPMMCSISETERHGSNC